LDIQPDSGIQHFHPHRLPPEVQRRAFTTSGNIFSHSALAPLFHEGHSIVIDEGGAVGRLSKSYPANGFFPVKKVKRTFTQKRSMATAQTTSGLIEDSRHLLGSKWVIDVVRYQPTERPIEDRWSYAYDKISSRLIVGVYDGEGLQCI
jgi:hypothetical protein